MFVLHPLGFTAMPEEKPSSKQEIAAGDASQNIQAGRDVNIHHPSAPAEQSSIVRPTNAQIAKYDSKLHILLEAIHNKSTKALPLFNVIVIVIIIWTLLRWSGLL
jgi:hypothetical protein